MTRSIRDNFTARTIRILADRAGHRCSLCKSATIGPSAESTESTTNLGVAAHIAAAAPGSSARRHDPAISSAQRSSIENGIWLCQTCHKLVDSDEVEFPAEKLYEIKRAHEAAVAETIGRPAALNLGDETLRTRPDLWFPVEKSLPWLIFAALEAPRFVGRENELAALCRFMEDDASFSWWTVLGAAGMGKSRLGREVCELFAKSGWDVGFLRGDDFLDWNNWQPERDTLIVIDYAASRAAYASTVAFGLCQRCGELPKRIRLLLLERDNGADWWSTMMRAQSQVESCLLESVLYSSDPLMVDSLSDKDIMDLAQSAAEARGLTIGETQFRGFPTIVRELDSRARPLFVIVATLESDSDRSRDGLHALRRLVRREVARWREAIRPSNMDAFLKLVILGTMLGDSSGELTDDGETPPVAQELFRSLLRDSADLETAIGGTPEETRSFCVRPDLLGELFLLDQFEGNVTSNARVLQMLSTAWKYQPSALCDFVRRAYSDFPTHPGVRFLELLVPNDQQQLAAWASLVVAMINATGHQDIERHLANIAKLNEARDEFGGPEMSIALFRAKNALAWSSYHSGDRAAAIASFKQLSESNFAENERAAALNNLGCILSDNPEEKTTALECFSRAIQMENASEESRACSLNNRADIFHAHGDYESAIRDRTSLLTLSHTSFDRRYIALARRANSKVSIGDIPGALSDLQIVINTPDIHQEQKAEAHVIRAELYFGECDHDKALQECDAVEQSKLLFPGTLAESRVLRAEVLCAAGQISGAIEFLERAIAMDDIPSDARTKAKELSHSLRRSS